MPQIHIFRGVYEDRLRKPLGYHLSFRYLFCLFLSGRSTPVLLYKFENRMLITVEYDIASFICSVIVTILSYFFSLLDFVFGVLSATTCDLSADCLSISTGIFRNFDRNQISISSQFCVA